MAIKTGIATLALVRDTFREAFARKIFWGFFGCSTAVILFFIFLMKIDVVEGALATISLFGKESHATDVTNLVRGVPHQVYISAYADALSTLFLIAAIVALVAGALSLALTRQSDFVVQRVPVSPSAVAPPSR